MCTVNFNRILFYYDEWQEAYRTASKPNACITIEFREGLPQIADYSRDNDKKKLLILDDLMRESSSDVILHLFTEGSHHKNISVIFITQNVYQKRKAQRDISLNIKYLMLFKNPRDKAQIQHLVRQIHPETRFFCATRSSMQRVYSILISLSISRRTAWTSLDFVAMCSPMTRCITHTYQSILNHADYTTRLSVGKELWSYVKHFSKINLAPLGALCHGDKEHRTAIVRTADKPLVKCTCECVLNVLQGVVKLSDNTKRQLRRHKCALRKLSDTDRMGNADWSTKKCAIVQSGVSFLPFWPRYSEL